MLGSLRKRRLYTFKTTSSLMLPGFVPNLEAGAGGFLQNTLLTIAAPSFNATTIAISLFLMRRIAHLRSRSISPFLERLSLPLTRSLCPPPPRGGPDWFAFRKFSPICTRVPRHLLRPLGLPGRVKGSSARILPHSAPP